MNYDKVRRISHPFFDHTYDGQTPPNGTSYAIRLSGSANEKTGLAKSLKVEVGDTLRFEVFAKYYESSSGGGLGTFASLLASIIAGTPPGGTFVDGLGYGAGGGSPVPYGPLSGKSSETGTVPKAYLNWLVFDKDYNLLPGKSGYKRITLAAKEDTTNVPHERLAPDQDIVVNESGYAYIYLSNENETPVEVYWDDFKIQHVKSPVISSQSYYPFGLTFDSYSQENTLNNQFQYNGKEHQDELNLGWIDYGARMYQPEIARWNGVDRSSENYVNQSPYHYAGNNPATFVDYNGNDYGVSVNHDARTITIQAHFITNAANVRAFNSQGRDNWNAQSGRNVFITGSVKDLKQRIRNGEDGGAYTININITSEVDNGPGADGRSAGDIRADADQTGTVNSFDTVEGFPFNPNQNGGTGDDEITVREDKKTGGTTTHETSHALGNAHIDQGGPLDPYGGGSVNRNNVAETLNGVGIGGNTAQRNARSTVGDGRLLNGANNQGLAQGKVISQARYNRIVRRIERREERQNQNQN